MSLITYNGESKVIKRICELLDTMTGINFVVVQTLPTTDISTSTIYLVPKQEVGTDNIYDEYINTDGTSQGWELIGTTEIDLSNYYTKTEVDNLIPDELSDLSDDSTHRLVTDTEKSTWSGKSDTDDKVKQTNTTASGGYRVLLSKTASDTEETDGVLKSSALRLNPNTGNIYIDRTHTDTSVKNEFLQIGNSIADGNQGANAGSIVLYGKGENYGRFYDNNNRLTANRTYELPDKSGVLMLESDVDKAETGERSLIYLPYYRSTPYTYRDVTYTYTSDGTLTANGTATGGNSNFHFRTFAMGLGVKGGKGYHLEGCPSGGSSSTYYIQLTFGDKNNTTLLTVNDYGNGIDVIAPPDTAYISSQFIIRSGVTVNNLSFIPKLTPIDFPTCDKTNAGTYTLKATVDVNGNVTYSWV